MISSTNKAEELSLSLFESEYVLSLAVKKRKKIAMSFLIYSLLCYFRLRFSLHPSERARLTCDGLFGVPRERALVEQKSLLIRASPELSTNVIQVYDFLIVICNF